LYLYPMYRDLDAQTQKDLKEYFQNQDYMVVAVPKEDLIRVYALRATNTVETARRVHSLEGEELKLMAYSVLSALLLTSLVKHATNQKVLFKIQNQGGVAVAEADGMGRVRGFIEGYPLEDWSSGVITVVKELRLGTPYTSIVPVVGRDVKEALSFYFDQSEQTKTYIDMFVKVEDEKVKEALAYLVQVLGGAKEDSVSKIEKNIKSLDLEGFRPEDIATAILKDMEPRLIGLKEVSYYCPCSEEIARASLLLLEEEELKDLLKEGPAQVVCKFCKRVYRFDKEQLMI
ncbi:MAG: Hsp33 family molecular chaperone HslO, partial [Aquificaceae bacterium]